MRASCRKLLERSAWFEKTRCLLYPSASLFWRCWGLRLKIVGENMDKKIDQPLRSEKTMPTCWNIFSSAFAEIPLRIVDIIQTSREGPTKGEDIVIVEKKGR